MIKTAINERATEGSRTLDRTITNRLLYQLSYGGAPGIIPANFNYRQVPCYDKTNPKYLYEANLLN